MITPGGGVLAPITDGWSCTLLIIPIPPQDHANQPTQPQAQARSHIVDCSSSFFLCRRRRSSSSGHRDVLFSQHHYHHHHHLCSFRLRHKMTLTTQATPQRSSCRRHLALSIHAPPIAPAQSHHINTPSLLHHKPYLPCYHLDLDLNTIIE